MKVYYIYRPLDHLVYDSFQYGGAPPKDGMLAVRKLAVKDHGGSKEQWVVGEVEVAAHELDLETEYITNIENPSSAKPRIVIATRPSKTSEGLARIEAQKFLSETDFLMPRATEDLTDVLLSKGVIAESDLNSFFRERKAARAKARKQL